MRTNRSKAVDHRITGSKQMFENFKQSAIAAAAAALFTFTAVGAAVGPARAIETTPVAYASAQVSVQANG
jgi:hypothetical protein